MEVAAIGPQVAAPPRAASAPPARRLTEAMLLREFLTPEEAEAFQAERAAHVAEQREERIAQAAEAALRRAETDAKARVPARKRFNSEGSRYGGIPPAPRATIGLPSSCSGHQRQIQLFHRTTPPAGTQNGSS